MEQGSGFWGFQGLALGMQGEHEWKKRGDVAVWVRGVGLGSVLCNKDI